MLLLRKRVFQRKIEKSTILMIAIVKHEIFYPGDVFVFSGVPQCIILEPLLFSDFIEYLFRSVTIFLVYHKV